MRGHVACHFPAQGRYLWKKGLRTSRPSLQATPVAAQQPDYLHCLFGQRFYQVFDKSLSKSGMTHTKTFTFALRYKLDFQRSLCLHCCRSTTCYVSGTDAV
jgi:hypothetical protein